jgi:hypothetical protein
MVPTKDAPPLPNIGVVDEKQEIGEQMRPINEKGRSIIYLFIFASKEYYIIQITPANGWLDLVYTLYY